MWEDFTTAVRELPAIESLDTDGKEGWVRSKRGRGNGNPMEAANTTLVKEAASLAHSHLNLNFPPEKHIDAHNVRGRGQNTANKDNVVSNRGASKGSGRGRGRGRGPPPVQPRHHSMASTRSEPPHMIQ